MLHCRVYVRDTKLFQGMRVNPGIQFPKCTRWIIGIHCPPICKFLSNTQPPVFIYSFRNTFLIHSWTHVQGSKIIVVITRILGKWGQETVSNIISILLNIACYHSNLSSLLRVANGISEISISQVCRAPSRIIFWLVQGADFGQKFRNIHEGFHKDIYQHYALSCSKFYKYFNKNWKMKVNFQVVLFSHV